MGTRAILAKMAQPGTSEDYPSEVRAFIAEALQAALKSAPRKQHIVPSSYLSRWRRPRDGMLQVTDLLTRKPYLGSAETIARRTDYYRLESPDLDADDIPPLLAEVLLGHIEGAAVRVIDALRGNPGRLDSLFSKDPSLPAELALFLGVQVTRGERYRAYLREITNHLYRIRYGSLNDNGIRRLLGGDVSEEAIAEGRIFLEQLNSGDIFVEPQQAALVMEALYMGVNIGPVFFDRQWVVFETIGRLVTTDEPIVRLGGPGVPRAEVGGLESAAIVVFPLGPHHLLALFRTDALIEDLTQSPVLDARETDELNLELVNTASRWVFERPPGQIGMMTSRRPSPPSFVFEELPTVDENRTILRHWQPSPWHSATLPPPLPVARWWARERWPFPDPPPPKFHPLERDPT